MNAKAHTGRKQKLLKDHPASLLLGSHQDLASRDTELPYMEEVHHRAETVTPLLKEILEFRPPLH